MRARVRTKLQNLWVKSKERGITGDSLGPLSAITTLATCLTWCTVAGLDPGLNFDLVCRSQSKQPEISNRSPLRDPTHTISQTAGHSGINSSDCFPGVRCTFIGCYQIVTRLENSKGFVNFFCSCIFFHISILYSSRQRLDTPSHRLGFLLYDDYLHCRFSLKASKLWIDTHTHTHLELGCKQ